MWTLQDAKNRFSAVVDAALAGAPQAISRRGKPVVVVLAEAHYRSLIDQAKKGRPPFAEHLLSFPAEPQRKGIQDKPASHEKLRVRPRDVSF
jgi:antitoxin Phd